MADLKVLIRDPNTGRLRLGISRPPQQIEGIDLLVQVVALTFLNNGGRSIFQPGRAGGLRDYIGLNVDPDDPSELLADLRLMTSRVEQQIKEEQIRTDRSPAERLMALQLVDLRPSSDSSEIEIVIAVINEEQQQRQAVVVT